MDLKQAMKERHTVRRFKNIPLSEETVSLLEERVRENNEKLGTEIRLVCNDDSAFNAALKLFLAKNAVNYFVLTGEDSEKLEENLGYASADLMLYAQTLGLNTWWVGGTYSRRTIEALNPGKKTLGIVVVGYGEAQGSPHRSKKFSDIAAYEGEMPQWFKDGVEAVLLAPTAVNRQAVRISGKGNEVAMSYAKGFLGKADLGICRYFFELGAGKENFTFAETTA